MKKIALVVDDFYQQNRIFDETDLIVNRDDCMRPWIELRSRLNTLGYSLDTCDIEFDHADLVIFQNMPEPHSNYFQRALNSRKPKIAIINELIHIHKLNANTRLHNDFDIIFTYQDKLIDNKKFRKLNYSFKIPQIIHGAFDRPIFCTMIAANKSLRHRHALYAERRKTIEWFDENHPDYFRLYGRGWNKSAFRLDQRNLLTRVINKWERITGHKNKTYKTYAGEVANKQSILTQAKFSICYENASDEPGWITEKIFDVFFSGCVPIYWGAPNIEEHVPSELYIDRRKFISHADLYKHLLGWQESDYEKWLQKLNQYVQSDQINEFSTTFFTDKVTAAILELIETKGF